MIGKTNSITGTIVDTADLTATAEDITKGKTAYTAQGEVVGTNESLEKYLSILNNTITEFVAPEGLYLIREWCFRGVKLLSAYISNGVKQIGNGAFYVVSTLRDLFLPNTLNYISPTTNPFHGCVSLSNVTLENGFNCNNLNLSVSTIYSKDTILAMFEALADRIGLTTYTLTLGKTNLNKMTEEEIAVATEKNWTIA